MPRLRVCLSFLALPLLSPNPSEAGSATLEIRISQSDVIFSHQARRPGNGYGGAASYYDLMVPNLSVVNRAARPVTIDQLWIELSAGGAPLARSYVQPAEVNAAIAEYEQYAKLGFKVALNAKFAADTILPPGVTVSASGATLTPGTALLASGNYVLARGAPDKVTVNVVGHTEKGEPLTANVSLPVREGRTRNQYRFPLEAGAWYVIGYPGIDSHHRFTQSTEFALDITRLDSEGRWFRNQGRRWSDWYAYGRQVLAAADGVVLKARNDSELDPAVWRPKDGESADDYEQRLEANQMRRFLAAGADPWEVAGGNYIVIRHANGEYSHYAHLAHGSVRVRVGQPVKQGDPIARVGGTGEAPVVHLHFSVSDSADAQHYAFHSIPIEFTNVAQPANARPSDEHGYFLVAH